jgi:membrane protein implicated in regulation of membrane protease activity
MDPALAWAIGGLVLVIVEMLSGTFYLLVLAVGAFGAAAVAWAGQGLVLQCVVASLVGAAGAYGVHLYRARNSAEQMTPIDTGQPAAFESWVDRAAGRARVRYRGASWEARLRPEEDVEPGATVYVQAAAGNTLEVSTRSPV